MAANMSVGAGLMEEEEEEGQQSERRERVGGVSQEARERGGYHANCPKGPSCSLFFVSS